MHKYQDDSDLSDLSIYESSYYKSDGRRNTENTEETKNSSSKKILTSRVIVNGAERKSDFDFLV